ncbi:CYCA2-2 [Linum perenne]
MDKENRNDVNVQGPTVRITRARARALGASGGVLPAATTSLQQDQKRVLKVSTKRQAAEENKASAMGATGVQRKKRAVLKEVTNILTEGSNASSINATKAQTTKQAKICPPKKRSEVAINIPMRVPKVEQENMKTTLVEGRSKVAMAEGEEIDQRGKLNEMQPCRVLARIKNNANGVFPAFHSTKPTQSENKGDSIIHQKQEALDSLGILDIDSDSKDPLVCSLYAPDIYKHMRVTELNQRPSADYMETLQSDVTPNMRGILIDWLVEVSEEYKLVPDTLYLTVNLIDRYLSKNFIEKQRLQLLGVTCMLIASKYEEICAPRVEEFCFITDNTYTKEEVLEMESRVLNILHFQLSVPTPKTLLRRFILAARASYKDPCVELEFLANYLAELTLVEYNFIKFLPSLVAASAVFLARWTLNQSDNPWNPTLEHYTNYKARELRSTVLVLEDLQLNVSSCPLNAIREKYRHQKFKSVANLTSPERVQSLFER